MENLSKHYYKLILLLGLITLTMWSITTSCTPEDDFAQKPIRYFPVQIITVNCDPSDLSIFDEQAIGATTEWKDENGVWHKDGPSKYYDISRVIEFLNKDYESSNIQFYSYGEIIVKGLDEYDVADSWYGVHDDHNHPPSYTYYHSKAFNLTFFNDEDYWEALKEETGNDIAGLGKSHQAQIRTQHIVRSIIRHEFDHLFGWVHEDERIPEKLYDYSFQNWLNSLASDKPL